VQATTIDLTEFAPRDCDGEDVSWALSTATALLGRGERAEAVRWLRRAASTASAQGQDHRAVALFKLAAEVVNEEDAAAEELAVAPPPESSGPRARRFVPRSSSIPPPPRRSSQASHSPSPEPSARLALGRSDVAPRSPSRLPDEDVPTAPWGLPPQPSYDDLEEVTAIMQGEGDTEPDLLPAVESPPPVPSARPSSAPRQPVRVAVVSGAGGEPTLVALELGTRPPRGSALATLTPTSARDAELIEALLAS